MELQWHMAGHSGLTLRLLLNHIGLSFNSLNLVFLTV